MTVALLLAAGSGPGGGAQRAGSPATKERDAMLTALTIGVATLAVAWLFSQVSPAWTTRYLGRGARPDLPAGLGRPRARRQPRPGGAGDHPRHLGGARRRPTWRTSPTPPTWPAPWPTTCAPGDLVVTLQPEQHPLIHYHLRNDMIEATQLGEVEHQGRDGLARRAGQARGRDSRRRISTPLLDRLPRSATRASRAPRHLEHRRLGRAVDQLVRRRSAQWGQALEADRRFTRDEARCRRSTAAPGGSGCAECSTQRPRD